MTTSTREPSTSAWIRVDGFRVGQFVLEIAQFSHIIGARGHMVSVPDHGKRVQNVCACARSLFSKERLRMRTSQQERLFLPKIELYQHPKLQSRKR